MPKHSRRGCWIRSSAEHSPQHPDGCDGKKQCEGQPQLSCWQGNGATRSFALCENRHNPTNPHVTSYIDARYKVSVYREGSDGEVFDLQTDPNELVNLWNDPQFAMLKQTLMHQMLQAILQSEPMKTPRVAQA